MMSHGLIYCVDLCTFDDARLRAAFKKVAEWQWYQWAVNCAPVVEFGNARAFAIAVNKYVLPCLEPLMDGECHIIVFTNYEVMKAYEKYIDIVAADNLKGRLKTAYYDDREHLAGGFNCELSERVIRAAKCKERYVEYANLVLRAAIMVGDRTRCRKLMKMFAACKVPLGPLFVVRSKHVLMAVLNSTIDNVLTTFVHLGNYGEFEKFMFVFPTSLVEMFPGWNISVCDLQMIIRTYFTYGKLYPALSGHFMKMRRAIIDASMNEINGAGRLIVKARRARNLLIPFLK